MKHIERVALIGFSGSGKSTVARQLAGSLGWALIDTDEGVEREWGATIPAIFQNHGEKAFRESERKVLRQALRRETVVVATGGGAPVSDEAWGFDLLGAAGTLVVALDATAASVFARLQHQAAVEGEAVARPLLAADDALGRIAELKQSRQLAYDKANLTLSTDHSSPEEIARDIARVVRAGNGDPLTLRLVAISGGSDIVVGSGIAASVGEAVRQRWPGAHRVWLVTDDHVGPLHAAGIQLGLEAAGFAVALRTVPSGEGSKSWRTAGELYDWLLGGGVERGDVLVALGGGVVGDLAGFVAATVLRGIGLVQIPTSLLAAVDSSVGGKTGINHAAGKNLIGSFLQPALVIADTALLHTMPDRELRSGWAEVVKHAVIQRSTPGGERADLAAILERNGRSLRALEDPVLAYVIWRNIALKAAVVAEDEREVGARALLNFGHTLGHAIEAADYRLLHGEAIALGMRAASILGVHCGTCDGADRERIERLLDCFELPANADFDEDRVLAKLSSDKKRVAGKQRYILPQSGGGVVIQDDVPEAAVRAALSTVNSATISP